jgi:hypothetical protein
VGACRRWSRHPGLCLARKIWLRCPFQGIFPCLLFFMVLKLRKKFIYLHRRTGYGYLTQRHYNTFSRRSPMITQSQSTAGSGEFWSPVMAFWMLKVRCFLVLFRQRTLIVLLSLIWGDTHKRQRKSMLPAFGVEVRSFVPLFRDTAEKVKYSSTIGRVGGFVVNLIISVGGKIQRDHFARRYWKICDNRPAFLVLKSYARCVSTSAFPQFMID